MYSETHIPLSWARALPRCMTDSESLTVTAAVSLSAMGGLLGGGRVLFRVQNAVRDGYALASASRNHAVGKPRREVFRPLRDGLRVDADGFCRFCDSAAKHL